MKLLLASLVFILFPTLASAQSGWRYIGPEEKEIVSMSLLGDLIFASVRVPGSGRLYRSLDAGENWERVDTTTLPVGAATWIFPGDSIKVLAAYYTFDPSRTRHFFISADSGRTWENHEMGQLTTDISRFYFKEGNHTGVLFGITSYGPLDRLYRSSDYGRTWSWPYPFPASSDGSRIGIGMSPTTPDVYVNVDTDIGGAYFFHSSDDGVTWEIVGWGQGLLSMMIIDPDDPLLIYAPFQSDFVRSTDGGLSWSPIFQGWRGIGVVHGVMSANNPDHLFFLALGDSPGVYHSTDRGATWVYDTLSALLPYKPTFGGPYEWLSYDAGRDRLYLQTAKGIYVRENALTDVKTTPQLSDFSMQTWPQPASESLTVKTELPTDASVMFGVYDTLGKLLREWQMLGPGSLHWDLRDRYNQNVPNGIYILTAFAGKEVVTQRIVIQR
ncbi:MAG: T9SS type A sorting domain-containing protein [Bacteroidia bacterium]|nr:T9SS type A sorting domain-containing protein [Bacteroidia bacterium]